MKRLYFDYCMEISYSVAVTKCHYTIKCIPVDNERQKILNYQIEMTPESKPEWAYDSHGNRYIFGCNGMPHSYFKYRIFGEAECGKASYDAIATDTEEMIYRHSHGFTMPGESMMTYYQQIVEQTKGFEQLSPCEKATVLMDRVYEDFTYDKNSTCINTTAEEAIRMKSGVCQDYAHTLISLLQLAGCSARYVTGLIIGEGASHAWVEVADHGKWYGFDPTNHMLVGDTHIKIGVGRDASECMLNRGIMHGGGEQQQIISVNVSEVNPMQKYVKKGMIL